MKNLTFLLIAFVLFFSSATAQENPDKMIVQGVSYLKAKDYKKANEIFKDLSVKMPDSAEVYYNLGVSEFRLGNFDNAVDALQESLKLKPNYPQANLFLGFSLENSERFSAAIEQFDKVLTALPENFDAWLEKGVCQFMLNDHQNAVKSIQQAIKIEPTAAYGHRKLADVYFQRALFPEAAVSYKTADKLEPNVYYVNFRIGSSYYNDRRYQEAAPFFKKATEIEPHNQTAHYMLGNAYLNAELYPQAIAAFEKLAAINPENADAIYGIGVAYLKQNDRESARKQLEPLRAVNYSLYSKLEAEINKPQPKLKLAKRKK